MSFEFAHLQMVFCTQRLITSMGSCCRAEYNLGNYYKHYDLCCLRMSKFVEVLSCVQIVHRIDISIDSSTDVHIHAEELAFAHNTV